MEGLSKFDELRRKTDREIVNLLNRKLDSGFALCASAGSAAEPSEAWAKAQRAYLEAARLLPLLGGIGPEERDGLRRRVRDLERSIERLERQLARPAEGCQLQLASCA
jgi:hypothetical protein